MTAINGVKNKKPKSYHKTWAFLLFAKS